MKTEPTALEHSERPLQTYRVTMKGDGLLGAVWPAWIGSSVESGLGCPHA